jgi:CDP-diacylglycerol--glycerol-3-phosphate 3-phosphatidyltransferase
MIGIRARPQINQALAPVGRALHRAGVSPDAVTVVGTVGLAGGALGFFPRGSFWIGTLVVLAFVFSDLLDGAIARAGGRSGPWGAFLDSSLDRIGDAAVFSGFVLWYAWGGHSKIMAAVSLYVLAAALVTSYLKARAASLGLSCEAGIAERAERLIVILVAAFFAGVLALPILLVIALWGLAAAGTVTVAQRLYAVHRDTRRLAAESVVGQTVR